MEKYQWYNVKLNIYIGYAEVHLMYFVGRLLIVTGRYLSFTVDFSTVIVNWPSVNAVFGKISGKLFVKAITKGINIDLNETNHTNNIIYACNIHSIFSNSFLN